MGVGAPPPKFYYVLARKSRSYSTGVVAYMGNENIKRKEPISSKRGSKGKTTKRSEIL